VRRSGEPIGSRGWLNRAGKSIGGSSREEKGSELAGRVWWEVACRLYLLGASLAGLLRQAPRVPAVLCKQLLFITR
jgi:hypothetical protein